MIFASSLEKPKKVCRKEVFQYHEFPIGKIKSTDDSAKINARWWFQTLFIFTPKPWQNDPI